MAQNKIRASVLGIGLAREVAAIEMIGLTRKGRPVYRVGDSTASREMSVLLFDVPGTQTEGDTVWVSKTLEAQQCGTAVGVFHLSHFSGA